MIFIQGEWCIFDFHSTRMMYIWLSFPLECKIKYFSAYLPSYGQQEHLRISIVNKAVNGSILDAIERITSPVTCRSLVNFTPLLPPTRLNLKMIKKLFKYKVQRPTVNDLTINVWGPRKLNRGVGTSLRHYTNIRQSVTYKMHFE